MAKKKPLIDHEDGVKDSNKREDDHRQDKRPKPVGPATGALDEALAEGTMEPDPGTPSRTPKE